ncbi:cysteine--tRNA ligase [Vaginisenegalia massiliensis]|uniref:cysteine--tRNA ligase n=1 Tax=Vaginisenegalia massiliensis TaxID=2058294 RepID=UPI000F545B2C|nr:cysteine--tRNA ligase [Vaginisenegalia massiliensis]
MPIQLYNTLNRQKEVFKPIQENKVTFYVCGPTVYNYIHIGNARSAVAFDTIRRYFEYRGYEVNYVSNFTDVDDKIIKAAHAEGLSPVEIANKYIEAFKEDTAAIGIKPATVHPRVMENIPEIIQFVETLIAKGYAYESAGDVYFRTEKFTEYGSLSDQSIKDLLVGASERVDDTMTERKENPLDFALWKTAKEGEIAWDSPWGQGRPGWHIECSVMATKYLGHTIDIHGGGQDLAFPHHENEIAQSECCTGHKFANYWLHNGFVTIGADEEKMSKSLGNFVLLRDLIREVDPQVVRFLLASVHYRRPLKYDHSSVEEARTNLAKIKEVMRKLHARQTSAEKEFLVGDQEELDQLIQLEEQFVEEMDDDFNAANGLTVIYNMVRVINRYLDHSQVSLPLLERMTQLLSRLLAIFGLKFEFNDLLDDEIQALIEERTQARLNKDFVRSDEIRDQLKAQGILLDDTPQGTQWKRVD